MISDSKKGPEAPADKGVKIICKACTASCRMFYDANTGTLRGNRCPRGWSYALNYKPEDLKFRTFLVKVKGGQMKRMALRTDQPVSEAVSAKLEAAVKELTIQAPVSAGALVLKDTADTGVDLLAIRKMPARK